MREARKSGFEGFKPKSIVGITFDPEEDYDAWKARKTTEEADLKYHKAGVVGSIGGRAGDLMVLLHFSEDKATFEKFFQAENAKDATEEGWWQCVAQITQVIDI